MIEITAIHVVAVGIASAIVVGAYIKHTMNVMKQKNKPLEITR